jgi:diadenylate cyclase
LDVLNKFIVGLDMTPVVLSQIEWALAIIDIAVVSFVIYKVIAWIKETRAWSLLKGILVLFVVYLIASLLKFYTIQWIIQNTLSVGIIAVIVIFQPEMRKALEQLGKGRITSVLDVKKSSGDSLISEQSIMGITAASFAMAKARTGALMVIQREVGLRELEASGVPIDAIISKQIIINIFEDKTPLHDGAVIIKENRIAAAACIMPLTSNDIAQELGTRHRAAVGVSEVSDAVIIVVSEETGAVSVACEGKLHRNLQERELVSMLSKSSQIKKHKNKKPPNPKNLSRKGR